MSTDADIAVLETQMKIMAEEIKDLKVVINRLPNWAVWIMMGGAGIIGFLTNWLIVCAGK